MIQYIFISIFFILIGLLIEKMIHKDFNILQLIYVLKGDVKKIFKAIFTEEPMRHIFDITLSNDIKQIIKPYSKTGFEIQLTNGILKNVPVIEIRFVEEHHLEEDEIEEILNFLKIKFKEYMAYYRLQWKTFVSYSYGSDYFFIYLYYAELESDIPLFFDLYRQSIRHKCNSGGVLRDMELDEELKNVN